MDLQEMVEYARRVAFRMNRSDPEMESCANRAGWRAFRTFDPKKGVPEKRWIARLTRQCVWCYWRKMRVRRQETRAPEWWSGAEPAAPTLLDQLPMDPADWQLLVEKHQLKWPLDVLARRHGTTKYRIRRMLRAAETRLREIAVSEGLIT